MDPLCAIVVSGLLMSAIAFSGGTLSISDFRVGLTAWLAAAAHEVPQELGDFGVLVHGAGRAAARWPGTCSPG
ncbi:MAG: hypothetical protein ABIL09_23470 [Gemmatimonadota bacterium]